jgi:hypothetical protein
MSATASRATPARVAAGVFERPIREVRCRFLGQGAPRVRIACFAITTRTPDAAVGQPFVAAGSLRDGRDAWCHENPPPAEGASGVGVRVAMSRACSGL